MKKQAKPKTQKGTPRTPPPHPQVYAALAFSFGSAWFSIVFAKLRYENKALKFSLVRVMSIAINIFAVLFFLIVCPLLQSEDTLSILTKSFYDPQVGVGYVFIANLIASSATLLVLLSEMKGIRWGLNYILWKNMIRYSLPLMIAGLAGMINETVDRILLKKLLQKLHSSLMH